MDVFKILQRVKKNKLKWFNVITEQELKFVYQNGDDDEIKELEKIIDSCSPLDFENHLNL